MKVKRYLVRSMPEAMAYIRRDLGPEALIISTRRVGEGGWWGWLRPPRLEVTAAVDSNPSPAEPGEELKREMAEIRGLLTKVSGHLGINEDEIEESRRYWQQFLLQLDVNTEITAGLLAGMPEQPTGGKAVDHEAWRESLVCRTADFLASAWSSKPRGRIMALVGPTGVGKTTTLAKLAARFSLVEAKKVGLLTIDTWRIGAVEQLRTYGEILGLPVAVALTPQDLQQKVDAYQDKDVILIDTVGRSPHDDWRLAELRAFLDGLKEVETYLVLSCTTKSHDLEAVVSNYGQLKPHRLIFTKTDESKCLGGIINVVASMRLPVAYITNGQNVPDDIERAEPEGLARLILGAEETWTTRQPACGS